MTDAEFAKHEGICRRCGRCCKVKIQWFDGTIRTGDYCPFYDREKKECMCYEQRFRVNPRCRTIAQSLVEGCLPPDCEYVKNFPGYRTPVIWRDEK